MRRSSAHWYRITSTIAVVAMSAVSLASCATAGPGASRSPGATEGGTDVTAQKLDAAWQAKAFEKYHTQQVEWRPCTASDGLDGDILGLVKASGKDVASLQCASVDAPLNWTDPSDGRSITLAITRLAPTGEAGDAVPLFTNPGGPGIAGRQHAWLLGTSPEFQPVLANHSLWGFDPRGVGNSSRIRCESKSEIHAVQLAECARDQPLAQFMGTSQVARDMEMLRALAGGKQLDYLGYSYGTVLGATYASLFPEHAGRMILDSAVDPEWGSLTKLYDQAVASAKAIGKLAGRCDQLTTSDGHRVNCPFRSEEELIAFKKELEARPLKASDGTTVDGLGLKDFLTSALYSSAADSLHLLGRAKAGEQAAIDEIAAQVASGGAQIDPVGQLTVCPSTPRTRDVNALVDHIKAVGVPELLGGPAITDELLAEFTDFDCTVLGSTGSELSQPLDARQMKGKIVVIGGTGDHATPFEHGRRMAKQLGNAVFVTLEGPGHGASFSQRSSCIDKLATAYLVKGVVPEDGTKCATDEG